MQNRVSNISAELSQLAVSIRIVAITVSLLLFSGCTSTNTEPETKPSRTAFDVKELVSLIQSGRYEEAQNKYIFPTISEFEKTQGASNKKLFSAQSPLESLYYLLKSAEKKEDAIVIDARFAQAYFYNGYILVEKRQNNEAKQNLQKAINLAPSRAHYLSELANVYQSEGNLEKAMELFDQAIEGAMTFESDDKTAVEIRRAYRGKAFSLTDLGRFDEAESLYRKCLELFENDEKAKYELDYIKNIRMRNSINKGKY